MAATTRTVATRLTIVVANECYFHGVNVAKTNDALDFDREPDNEHDRNAVMMCLADGTELGHLKRTLSRVVAPLIDNGSIELKGVVKDITEGTGGRDTVLVKLTVVSTNLTENRRIALCNRIQDLKDQGLV